MTPRHLDTPRFQLLDTLARRLTNTESIEDDVRQAVDILTADADPGRAGRLAVGPREPSVLVERLAVWAAHRASDTAVAEASSILTGTRTQRLHMTHAM